MPDFDKLHTLATLLAHLTSPENRNPGLISWCSVVADTWKEIADRWRPQDADLED